MVRVSSAKVDSPTKLNNDFVVILGKNATVKRIKLGVPGAMGDVTYQFFDGPVADNKPIPEGIQYLGASGDTNMNFKLTEALGQLGIRVAGITNTPPRIYTNVEFQT